MTNALPIKNCSKGGNFGRCIINKFHALDLGGLHPELEVTVF